MLVSSTIISFSQVLKCSIVYFSYKTSSTKPPSIKSPSIKSPSINSPSIKSYSTYGLHPQSHEFLSPWKAMIRILSLESYILNNPLPKYSSFPNLST